MDNIAGKCMCCECQGKLCMMYHKGHSHKMEALESEMLQPKCTCFPWDGIHAIDCAVHEVD